MHTIAQAHRARPGADECLQFGDTALQVPRGKTSLRCHASLLPADVVVRRMTPT